MALNKLVERMNHMRLADEFVERRFIVFQCHKCQHPAMEITTKTAFETIQMAQLSFALKRLVRGVKQLINLASMMVKKGKLAQVPIVVKSLRLLTLNKILGKVNIFCYELHIIMNI